MSENVGRLLRRLMAEAPDGPMTISELARRIDKPRSTIHRHLAGYSVSNQSIQNYAKALTETMEDRERVTQELMRTAGHAVPSTDTRDDDIAALMIALRGFDKDDIQAVWQTVGMVRKYRTLMLREQLLETLLQ